MEISKKLSIFIKNRDTFGHPVGLTIKNSREQTSRIGGVITMMIYIFCIVNISIKSEKMFAGKLDNIIQSARLTDFEKVGRVKMKGMIPYLFVQALNEKAFQYVNIELIHVDGFTSTTTKTLFEECTQEHFSPHGDLIQLEEEKRKASEYFKDYGSSKFYCVNGFSETFVSGALLGKDYSSIEIKAAKNELYEKADNKEELDDYIFWMSFKLHFIKQMIDYQQAGEPLRYVVTSEYWAKAYQWIDMKATLNNIEMDIHRYDFFSQVKAFSFVSLALKE